MPLPVGSFLEGDAVTGGGEDVAAADGHQLTSVVSPCHVVQHSRVVDECIQLAVQTNNEDSFMKTAAGCDRLQLRN